MSTWAGPYLQVIDAAGRQVSWTPPVDLPLTPAPGASLADLGAPGAKVRVRWRTPLHTNPRSLTGAASDPGLLALACRIRAAVAAGGAGWAPDASGGPVPIPLNAAAPTPPPAPAPLAPTLADNPVFASFPAAPTGYRQEALAMSKYIAELLAGRRTLGSTVPEVATHLQLSREAGWSPTNRSNKNNILGFIEQILVYREPRPTDPVEIARHMRAVLAIPGVEVGAPMHIALVTAADLAYALEVRRTTDRRTQLLNAQAEARYAKATKTFEERQARYVAGLTRHRPTPPAATRSLRAPQPVSERTYALFAETLGSLMVHAEQYALLVAANPWTTFKVPTYHSATTGSREADLRLTPPLGAIIDIAEHVATLGPLDRRTGRPTGERFKALILAGMTGARNSELDALAPGDFHPADPDTGRKAYLIVSKSLTFAPTAASPTGASALISDRLKNRKPGQFRKVELPDALAEEIATHIARGYSSPERLFTGPRGGTVLWSNLVDTYWTPAVTAILGASSHEQLRTMPRKWLRKTAMAWMIREGLSVLHVTRMCGNTPDVFDEHYLADVTNHHSQRSWSGWDDAWEHGASERTVD